MSGHRFELLVTVKSGRVLADNENEPVSVELTHPDLGSAELVVLRMEPRGQDVRLIKSGYASEEGAREARRRWAFVLRRALAACWIGADFGERGPQGGLAPWLRRTLEEEYSAEHGRELKINSLGEGLYPTGRGSVNCRTVARHPAA